VRQTIDDQFSVLCEAAKLAERMNDAAKARKQAIFCTRWRC
jgi:hypothetical protein